MLCVPLCHGLVKHLLHTWHWADTGRKRNREESGRAFSFRGKLARRGVLRLCAGPPGGESEGQRC